VAAVPTGLCLTPLTIITIIIIIIIVQGPKVNNASVVLTA
jgi:hypothetical protein